MDPMAPADHHSLGPLRPQSDCAAARKIDCTWRSLEVTGGGETHIIFRGETWFVSQTQITQHISAHLVETFG